MRLPPRSGGSPPGVLATSIQHTAMVRCDGRRTSCDRLDFREAEERTWHTHDAYTMRREPRLLAGYVGYFGGSGHAVAHTPGRGLGSCPDLELGEDMADVGGGGAMRDVRAPPRSARFECPATISFSTSCSRGVSPNAVLGAGGVAGEIAARTTAALAPAAVASIRSSARPAANAASKRASPSASRAALRARSYCTRSGSLNPIPRTSLTTSAAPKRRAACSGAPHVVATTANPARHRSAPSSVRCSAARASASP